MSAGALGNIKPADDIANQVTEANKAGVEAKTGKSYETFTAVSYGTQTVAGTNYFIKINVGDECIHARIFRGLDGSYEVHSVQDGHAEDSEIKYF